MALMSSYLLKTGARQASYRPNHPASTCLSRLTTAATRRN